MNISIRAQDFELTRAIDLFTRHRLRTALGRIDEDIVTISVYLKDANGPRGGVDKQVLIHVRMRNKQVITLAGEDAELYAAIAKCVKRTKRAVRRHIRKSRHFDKHRLRDLLDHGMAGGLSAD